MASRTLLLMSGGMEVTPSMLSGTVTRIGMGYRRKKMHLVSVTTQSLDK